MRRLTAEERTLIPQQSPAERRAYILAEVRVVCQQHLPEGYRVGVFGSQAGRSDLKKADIDLGIEGPAKLDRLIVGRLALALEEIPTLYDFDLVDLQAVSASFRETALSEIEWLW